MTRYFLLILTFCMIMSCNNTKNESKPEEMAQETTAPVEIGDTALIAIGKANIAALTAGDIEAYVAHLADDAISRWNNGDSVVGKQAIKEYWTKRRTEMITSITFANDLWLPVKVNTPAAAVQSPGHWLLGWYQVTATYVTGKSMTQWIHTDWHFNADGKVDQIIQYIDRVPINAAMSK